MAIKNRYFKTTQGISFELAVCDSVQATAGVSLNTFRDAGVLNKLAIFKDDIASTGPTSVATGTVVPVADRKKGIIFAYSVEADAAGKCILRLTTPLRADSIKAEKIQYKAEAKQVNVMAHSATPADGHMVQIKVIETTPGYQPLPTWDYVTNLIYASGNPFATAMAAIVAKVALNREEEFFTLAYNTTTYSAPTWTVSAAPGTITTGVITNTSAGAGIFTTVVPSGTGTIPLVIAGGAGSGAAGYAVVTNGVVTGIVITAAGSGYSGTPTVTVAAQTTITGYNTGLIVGSTDAARTFRIVASVIPTKANTAESTVVYTQTNVVAPTVGSGSRAQVTELQIEDSVRRGIGHFYTDDNTSSLEFGVPTSALGTTTTFDFVVITGFAVEASPTPTEQHLFKKTIMLAVPSGTTDDDIVAMFAF